MQVGRVLNFKGLNKTLMFFKNNKYSIILTLFFLAGLFYSAYLFEEGSSLEKIFENYITDTVFSRTDKSFFNVFINSFFRFMLFVLLVFVFGSSMFGIIFIPFIILIAGFIYGNLASVLYSEFELLGISFFAVILLPSAVIFILTLIFSAKESIKFSLKLAKLSFPAVPPSNLYLDFKLICTRFLLFVFYIFLAAIIDAFISHNFLERFSLV